MVDGPGENCQEAGVLGVVVGLVAEKLAEAGYDAGLRVFNNGAVAGGARVAAGTAIAVGGEPLGGRAGGGGGRIWKEISGHRFLV
jgi:hypothetical protein